ncbi:MAG: substrate-binding domain-containing protein [Clostridiales bacterium]|nr:substrate-binding domain-containing protein [Clostridiales bacterium]
MNKSSETKHEILSNWIRGNINNGAFPPGTKIPSEKELALKFGYSRQTVRYAIGRLASEGILIKERGKGTFVQDNKTKNTRSATNRIGVITTYLDDYIFPCIIQGIEGVLTEKGYTLSLGITYNNSLNEEQCLLQILESGVDGIIIEGTKSALPNRNEDLFKNIKKHGIPLVFINGFYSGFNNSYVVMNDVEAGGMITEELINKGHIEIGGIFKSDDMQGIKRFEGMIQMAKKHNIAINDRSILWYTTEDKEYLFNGKMDQYILDRFDNCTGVVCYNDEIASKFIEILKRNHLKVKDDISVVSFDNSFLAKNTLYNLTSIDYPSKQIGITAAKVLLKMIENPLYEKKIKLKPSIIIRDSVKTLK